MMGLSRFLRTETDEQKTQRLRAAFSGALASNDVDAAMRIAEKESRSPGGGEWFTARLVEMRLDAGDHAYVTRLAAEGHPIFATLDGRKALARARIMAGDEEAESAVLDLVLNHETPDGPRLLRLLAPSPGLLDRACAAFQRSARSKYRKAIQGSHLVELAVLAGDVPRGFEIATQILSWLDGAKPERITYARQDLTAKLSEALADFHEFVAEAADEFFLISGTLLGVMRDGKLIGYDTDIDIGAFDDRAIQFIEQRTASSRIFSRDVSTNISGIKIRHRNGVVVDVFLHHRDGDTLWHGGPAHVWENRVWWSENEPERFAQATYRGRTYNVPKLWEQYLVENYGEAWTSPETLFVASIDAPNRRIADMQLSRLLRRTDFVKYYHRADFRTLMHVLKGYRNDFGEDDYLVEARRILLSCAGSS